MPKLFRDLTPGKARGLGALAPQLLEVKLIPGGHRDFQKDNIKYDKINPQWNYTIYPRTKKNSAKK